MTGSHQTPVFPCSYRQAARGLGGGLLPLPLAILPDRFSPFRHANLNPAPQVAFATHEVLRPSRLAGIADRSGRGWLADRNIAVYGAVHSAMMGGLNHRRRSHTGTGMLPRSNDGAGLRHARWGPQVALAPPRHLAISRRIPIFVKVASRERWTGGCHDLARVLAGGRDGLNASRPPEERRYSSCGWRGDFRRKRIPGMSD